MKTGHYNTYSKSKDQDYAVEAVLKKDIAESGGQSISRMVQEQNVSKSRKIKKISTSMS